MASEEVRNKLFEKIEAAAEEFTDPISLLRLAEAYAWLYRPGASHGGGTTQES